MFPGCNDQKSYWNSLKLTVLKITSLTVKYLFLLYENVNKFFSQWSPDDQCFTLKDRMMIGEHSGFVVW